MIRATELAVNRACNCRKIRGNLVRCPAQSIELV
jgi:hypothetical protein